jgi:hypothetical protein
MYECAVRTMRKKLELILTVATLEARNGKEAVGTPMVGSGGICVWQESGFSRREDVFKFNLAYKEILYISYLCCKL